MFVTPTQCSGDCRHWPWGGHTSSERGTLHQLFTLLASACCAWSCVVYGSMWPARMGVRVVCALGFCVFFQVFFSIVTSVFSLFLFLFFSFILFGRNLCIAQVISFSLCACGQVCGCVGYVHTAHVHLPCMCLFFTVCAGRAERSITAYAVFSLRTD